MPTIKGKLLNETFSDVAEIEKRVYYTLTNQKDLTAHRTAKAVGLLFARLHAKGLLGKKDLDALLLECLG